MGEGARSLPALAPNLKLTRAPDTGGDPFWTLHDPAANTYFKIDWLTFEALSRLYRCRTLSDLKYLLESETTLRVTDDDIAAIVTFLHQNGLTALKDQIITPRDAPRPPWWKILFHGYLYFTVPLFRPQNFLRRTYPAIAFLFSRAFITAMLCLLTAMIVVTLPRLDEFFHTFTNMLSFEGAIRALIVLAFVKTVHEFSHAYAATKYGVDVPHMGVALIVLYPVLYTETTASWKLSSRRARFHIAMAGVTAELCLATVFLMLWHLSPSGSAMQTASFLVVAVSLVSSLLVNLNPLMRFDGYYMFSDALGIDNLQSRSIAFARWRLRQMLFGLSDRPPEEADQKLSHILIVFGGALLIYRFFLFSGIALLVYHVFFQPLGFGLMMVELIWFILLPIFSELKIWHRRRDDILRRRRSLFPAGILMIVVGFVLIPWHGASQLPAMLHAAKQFNAYPPAPGFITALNVTEGQKVEADDVLAVLDSPELDMQISKARQALEKLETLRRRAVSNPALLNENTLSAEAVEKAQITLHSLSEQKDRLTIRAPFAGTVKDMSADIQAGRAIGKAERMLTLVAPATWTITAYATESEQSAIEPGARAVFRPATSLSDAFPAHIRAVAATGSDNLPWPELASINGGPIAADRNTEGAPSPRRALYEVRVEPLQNPSAKHNHIEAGYLRVERAPTSYISRWIKDLNSVIRREAKIN